MIKSKEKQKNNMEQQIIKMYTRLVIENKFKKITTEELMKIVADQLEITYQDVRIALISTGTYKSNKKR